MGVAAKTHMESALAKSSGQDDAGSTSSMPSPSEASEFPSMSFSQMSACGETCARRGTGRISIRGGVPARRVPA